MKACPKCGAKFNWWQSVTGEFADHVRLCPAPLKHDHSAYMATNCRGCPAECFKDTDFK